MSAERRHPLKRNTTRFYTEEDMANGRRRTTLLAWLALLALMGVVLLALYGCMVVPHRDDPLTEAVDESETESVAVGAEVYDQPAGTGTWFSRGTGDDGNWSVSDWLELGIEGALGMMVGNAGVSVLTERGRSNLINLFLRRSTAGSKVASAAAVILPTDSPVEAKAITVEKASPEAKAVFVAKTLEAATKVAP